MNRPVLVTGASGFVGAHLARTLALLGHTVIALGGSKPCPNAVQETATLTLQCDLTQLGAADTLIREHRPEAVIHAAALARVAECQEAPAKAERANVEATSRLIDACLAPERDARPFLLFFSTDMVYDGTEAPPGGFSEIDPPSAVSVYSQSKLRAETLVRSAHLDAVVVRTALVFGGEIGGQGGFLSWLIQGLNAGECPLFSDELRTPIWTGDIARIIARFLDEPRGARAKLLEEAGTERLVHAGGASCVTRVELGEIVAATFGLDRRAIVSASRLAHPSAVPRPGDIGLCSNKLERCLGIRPTPLAEALSRIKLDQ